MTEHDLFTQYIIMVYEKMVAKCRKMDAQAYEEWKNEWLESTPPGVEEVSKCLLGAIENVVRKGNPD